MCGEGMTQTFPIPTHQSGSLEGKFIARMPAYRFTFRQLHRLLSGKKKKKNIATVRLYSVVAIALPKSRTRGSFPVRVDVASLL